MQIIRNVRKHKKVPNLQSKGIKIKKYVIIALLFKFSPL